MPSGLKLVRVGLGAVSSGLEHVLYKADNSGAFLGGHSYATNIVGAQPIRGTDYSSQSIINHLRGELSGVRLLDSRGPSPLMAQ